MVTISLSPGAARPRRMPPTSAPRFGTAPKPRITSCSMRSTTSRLSRTEMDLPAGSHTYAPGIRGGSGLDEVFTLNSRIHVRATMNGTLYIVATPIGNLEDITYRAVRTLGEADLIACEDTRQTRKLLDRYAISKPLTSYHEHNEEDRSDDLIRELEAGKNVALVSDAGTPLIADPGYRLVRKARERGIQVSPIPGPSAIVAALSASGLPTDAFEFQGFFSAKRTQRHRQLEQLRDSRGTQVFYEAPHRILETLDDIAEIFGDRTLVVARELTKVHEEFLTGTAAEIREVLRSRAGIKGEFTVMIGKGAGGPADERPIPEVVAELVAQGVPRMDAYKRIARERGLSKRDVYKQCESQ